MKHAHHDKDLPLSKKTRTQRRAKQKRSSKTTADSYGEHGVSNIFAETLSFIHGRTIHFALFLSSRARSISTALHLPERMKFDKLLASYVMDVSKAGLEGGNSWLDSSSSSDDADESASENEISNEDLF